MALLLLGVTGLFCGVGCMERRGADGAGAGAAAAAAPLVVEGTVLEAVAAPAPGQVPYRDCLLTAQCRVDRVLSGEAPASDTLLVTAWAFRDRIVQSGQDLKPGAIIRFTLEPLDLAGAGLDTTMRLDASDDTDSPEFWAAALAVIKPGGQAHVEPPVFGAPLAELPPLNRVLVEQGEGFYVGRDGFCFGMPTREIYRKDFWKLPQEAAVGAGVGAAAAVRDFHAQLTAQGIPLLVVVIPRAASVHADLATGLPYDWQKDGPVNAPVEDWCQHLRDAGIDVLNLTAQFLEHSSHASATGATYPLFLPNDSHFAPAGARLAAMATVDHLRERQWVPAGRVPVIEEAEIRISHAGDFADLMQKEGVEPLACETVVIPAAQAPAEDGLVIQLLGDSLTRIFSEHRSSYGDHLKARIGARWDIIAPNAGVTTARRILARSGHLADADLVVWQIAEEFLGLHHLWRRVPMNAGDTLRLWRADLLEQRAEAGTAGVQPFDDRGEWDHLVGIRVEGNSRLTWNGIRTGPKSRLTVRVRVGAADIGVSQRAAVGFRVFADDRELFHTALVPRRDRPALSEAIAIPLPEAPSMSLRLITEVTPGGTPPAWIDWVFPEVVHAGIAE